MTKQKMIKVKAGAGKRCTLPRSVIHAPGDRFVTIREVPVEVPWNNRYVQKRVACGDLVVCSDLVVVVQSAEPKEPTK